MLPCIEPFPLGSTEARVMRRRSPERVSPESRTATDRPQPRSPVMLPCRYSKRQIECPSCSQRMETHPYYGPGNIVVDTCSECGYLWLDHGEISRVENASYVRRSTQYTWDSPPETVSERLQGAAMPPAVDYTDDSGLRVIADLLFG